MPGQLYIEWLTRDQGHSEVKENSLLCALSTSSIRQRQNVCVHRWRSLSHWRRVSYDGTYLSTWLKAAFDHALIDSQSKYFNCFLQKVSAIYRQPYNCRRSTTIEHSSAAEYNLCSKEFLTSIQSLMDDVHTLGNWLTYTACSHFQLLYLEIRRKPIT